MPTLQELTASPLFRPLATIALGIVVVMVLVRLARRAVRSRIADGDLRYRASKGLGVLGYVVIVVLIVAELGGRLSGFTVALGAASAGVAFALQEVIASFAGWLAIGLGGYYKVGDRVQLGGIKGDVIDIGVIRTTLMETGGWVNGDLYSGRIVRVANSFVFKEPVFNYSGEFPFVWDEIVVPIRYGSDYRRARAILQEAAAAVCSEEIEAARERWDELVRSFRIEPARVEPMVTMIANDNWVELTLRYVVNHRARRLTKDALFEHILAAVDATEGRVALGSATFELVGAPKLGVEVSTRAAEPG